ncbi:hypothetical protein [Telmatospirillum sp.]|uniref:hypothetical protein n=1 Tax=Telmatospirillum sp. TaxID=2079197 RepID=UPI00285136F8|nr:hypothetical protein [Telmatospirillum sp.]MDR3440464.1 hypothetical protein [Telmatospirillum sp.]
MNRRIAKMLSRFGMNGDKILAEAAAERIGAQELLSNPALINPHGLIRLHCIGTMDAMLELASGGKPAIALPNNPKEGLLAIVLFLRLNHTPEFSWREKDTPSAWSTRIIDALFASLASKKIFGHSDFLALDRLSRNPLWQGLFGSALELFLNAVADQARVSTLDRGTSQAAVQAFRASSAARQARLPKVKYGNPLASFKEIAEYAIGEYLEGLDVNEALERTLVQAQLGLSDESGKQRFEAFLRDNRIQPDTFPTTVSILYDRVQSEVRFQESEGEVAAVCYAYASEMKQTLRVEKLFSNFADAIFPVAAKCRRHFVFGGISPRDGATVIARWAGHSRLLADLRKGGLSKQVSGLVSQLGGEERRALLAFRDGRTEAKTLNPGDVERYVRARCKMLTLSAQQAKITRVEQLLHEQINGAEQFILRPGQPALQDMTYGVDVFFRALRTVMEDICTGTGALLREQMKVLHEFQRRYGPLATIALLCPMPVGMRPEKWLQSARSALRQVDNDFFDL